MKRITTTTSVQTADASLDPTLNPVQLASKEIVPSSVAFPRTAPSIRPTHLRHDERVVR
jgi:hypothetical protein